MKFDKTGGKNTDIKIKVRVCSWQPFELFCNIGIFWAYATQYQLVNCPRCLGHLCLAGSWLKILVLTFSTASGANNRRGTAHY